MTRSKPIRRVPYELLSNIELILDASGARTNTDNDYAEVDVSGNIVVAKSVAPATTGREFETVGTGVTLAADGSFAFDGNGRLRTTSASNTWDFLHYASPLSDLKYTIFAVVKFGNSFRPTAAYGLLGNNGTTSAAKGCAYRYNNSSSTFIDAIHGSITRGTATEFIAQNQKNNIGISNRYFVLAIKVDLSEVANASKMRYYVNNEIVIIDTVGGNNNISPVATPTNLLEIGACGNNIFPLVGNIKELIIAREASSEATLRRIMRALANKHKVVMSDGDYLNDSMVMNTFQEVSNGLYHLQSIISQNPVSPYNILSVYSEGNSHVFDAGKKLVGKLATRKTGLNASTFGSQFDIFNPASTEAVQDGGGGYDHNGRFHIFTDTHTGFGTGETHKVYQLYSDNNGSSWTTVDLTSLMPSDGLATWRFHGNLITNDGVWMKTFYKFTEEGNFTNSAIYLLRSTDGLNWSVITVKASSGTYINESSIVALDDDNLLIVSRNESTNEWTQFISTDNGASWSSQGDLTFGLTITSANPVRLDHFTHNSVRVIVAYVPDRANDVLYAVYGTAANLIANGLTGWDLDTMIPIWKTNAAPNHLHYGDVAHLDGKISAIGMWPYDPYPGSGGTVNREYYLSMPTWQIGLIETELGI